MRFFIRFRLTELDQLRDRPPGAHRLNGNCLIRRSDAACALCPVPTVAQFGFFAHLGPSSVNFPQIFSTDFEWSEGATLDFLNWQVENRVRIHRDRRLNLGFSKLMNGTTGIAAAYDCILLQSTNIQIDGHANFLRSYLDHAEPHVRYAAAFYILDKLDGRLWRGLLEPEILGLRRWRSAAEDEIRRLCFDTPAQQSVTDAGLSERFDEIMATTCRPTPEKRFKIRANLGLQESPLSTKALRELLSASYGVLKQGGMRGAKPPSPIDLGAVPLAFKYRVLRVYFALPPEIADGEILPAVQKYVQVGRNNPFSYLFREDCAVLLMGQSLLDALLGQVIRVIDSH